MSDQEDPVEILERLALEEFDLALQQHKNGSASKEAVTVREEALEIVSNL